MSKDSMKDYSELNLLYGLLMILFFSTLVMGCLSVAYGDLLIGKVLITFAAIDIGLLFYVGHKRRHVRSDFNAEIVINSGDEEIAS